MERVFLDIPDPSHRELLICLHYLQHLIRVFYNESLGINILGRDNPWDFKLELSTGKIFNLEITAIADNDHHFVINKREGRLSKWCREKTIPLHELIKLNDLFPNQKIAQLIKDYQLNGLSSNDSVNNPLNDLKTRITISNLLEPVDELDKQIRSSITRKVNKKHSEKEKTVIIVDNRTSAFDLSEYQNASEILQPFMSSIPFPEVWFYTGYYSDNDGNNAEYCFSPIKVTQKQSKILEQVIKKNKMVESGLTIL